ncbi:hypothetical protein COO59_06750 [Mixta theicola]|uniref:Uncharacterized protein n=1 Tax=Mixta theicola TaxID=1458355 RepID=A0A2K1QAZ5_9GAMM|nr:hypothetical protein [Mixta theicola]PNS12204.1 hypothetical protein COO59_06750 [Mixta theicola]
MNNLFSYLGIAAVWAGFLSLIFLFFYYCANKAKYEVIVKLYYEKGFSFHTPYHFHSLMGFFGSFTLIYYFVSIKKKKKPLLMFDKNSEVYNFFDAVPDRLSGWMINYYRVTLFMVVCIIFIFVMTLMKYVYSNYFS